MASAICSPSGRIRSLSPSPVPAAGRGAYLDPWRSAGGGGGGRCRWAARPMLGGEHSPPTVPLHRSAKRRG